MISMSNAIFVLFASILVFSMTPGLAFFYGGQKRRQYDDFNFFDLRNWNFTVLSAADMGCASAGVILELSEISIISFLSGVNLMKPFGTTHIPLGVDIIFQLMFALVNTSAVCWGNSWSNEI